MKFKIAILLCSFHILITFLGIPAFADIAKRYPANKVYFDLLANKIIIGGRGTWGTPLMDPHPELSFDDAKLMVYYIMSLKNQK